MTDQHLDEKKQFILSGQCLQILDHLNIGAFTIDLNRRISSLNRSMEALIGIQELDAIGKGCREIFKDVPCYGKCPFKNENDPDTEFLDIEIMDQQKVQHLISRMVSPIYDSHRNIVGCLTIFQDHSHFANLISRIHYEERSMKIVLDNLDIGIFTVNRGGYITFFNNAIEQITGYNRRQMLGRLYTALYAQDPSEDPTMLKKSIVDGKIRTHQNGTLNTPEGTPIPVRASYMPLKSPEDRIIGGLATIRDMTLAQELNHALTDRYTFHDMIGKDPAMLAIFERIRIIAKSHATVMIEGSTGTGKDILAKVIHSESDRSGKPFVKINCAAIPENLLESELFGYRKGAFTGADRNKPGRFQEADGGTFFLDEIAELPITLQAKLLRVIEDKEFYPLGARHTEKVDVRILSATNRDLETRVKNKEFREDLFYRLNVLRFKLPSLKERRGDIPLLINHFLRRLSAQRGERPPQISKEAMEILLNHDYPGNIRELENILEHAMILSQSEIIRANHLPDQMQQPKSEEYHPQPISKFFEDDQDLLEREKIIRMLDRCNWNRKETAQALKMERTTLWRKMKRWGLINPGNLKTPSQKEKI